VESSSAGFFSLFKMLFPLPVSYFSALLNRRSRSMAIERKTGKYLFAGRMSRADGLRSRWPSHFAQLGAQVVGQHMASNDPIF
jgi:hypothetical protein